MLLIKDKLISESLEIYNSPLGSVLVKILNLFLLNGVNS